RPQVQALLRVVVPALVGVAGSRVGHLAVRGDVAQRILQECPDVLVLGRDGRELKLPRGHGLLRLAAGRRAGPPEGPRAGGARSTQYADDCHGLRLRSVEVQGSVRWAAASAVRCFAGGRGPAGPGSGLTATSRVTRTRLR